MSSIDDTRNFGGFRADRHRTLTDAPDGYFLAVRDEGHFYSAPYGTNFHRLILLIGAGDGQFNLGVYVDTASDRVIAVDAWWSFSLL